MRKVLIISLVVICLLVVSPIFAYWRGLSNIAIGPLPSNSRITHEQQNIIWLKEFGEGKPRVERITPYGYIAYIYCVTTHSPHSNECKSKYPGVRLAALSVRTQVAEQVRGRGNTVWQFSWMAYSIWVTQNWNIEQILATYNTLKPTRLRSSCFVQDRTKHEPQRCSA